MPIEHSDFQARCQALFAEVLGNGRRWKTACAQGLGIGRATLYRYFEDESAVPDEIWLRLERLEQPNAPSFDDRTLVAMFASALVKVQAQIDEKGFLSSPYPAELRRAFDLGAARNFTTKSTSWPTDLDRLMALAKEPMFRWVPSMSWDKADEFFAARLVEDGEISTDCRKLAVDSGNPEREIEENIGYEMLIGICRDRLDGEDLYRIWRRTVIENPVIAGYAAIIANPGLADIERVDEIVEAFYQRIPDAIAVNGQLPICTISGTILRRVGEDGGVTRFHTECRDPEAIRRANAGVHDTRRYRPGMMQLRRAFRTYWCLPGRAELELEWRFREKGWQTTLWPNLDRVDLVATSASGRRLAIDVKDYLSPNALAARFNGFKEFAADHECYLVVPDYIPEVDGRFEARFEAFRASLGKTKVALQTVSGLIDELDAA
ncbi:MAG: hypothetical protein FD176_193 [Rhodospirillaceae bacterium]|nr:MAG: hypothetical protein FD176_193 [Rhodospirillaceae bacterium]TNC98711.1 MAG: Uncharacterized protein FD119_182 [Stygiobacter sp.]